MGQWATGEWRSGVTLRRAEGARGTGAAPIKAMAPCGTELPTTSHRRSCVALRRRSESDRAHLLELLRLEITRSERRIRTPENSGVRCEPTPRRSSSVADQRGPTKIAAAFLGAREAHVVHLHDCTHWPPNPSPCPGSRPRSGGVFDGLGDVEAGPRGSPAGVLAPARPGFHE